MVYDYTKPRRPIAATFNSPGPCYGLPSLVGYQSHDPRSSHSRGPAYPFGLALGRETRSALPHRGPPGPATYAPDPKVNRTGRAGVPSYSLQGKHDDLTPPWAKVTPGPAAYAPERAGRAQTPAYSFGTRHRRHSAGETPAPNQYSVPSVIGRAVQSGKRQAPAYSLSGRTEMGSFHVDQQKLTYLDRRASMPIQATSKWFRISEKTICEGVFESTKTPGPGSYVVTDATVYKTRPPKYSLSGRFNEPSELTRIPGPGSHSPERVWVHKRLQPSFSFGIRHSPYSAPLITKEANFDD